MRQTHRSLLSQVPSMCALMSSHGNVGTVAHRSTMLPSRILHVGPLYQLPMLRCRLRLWARPRPRRALADFRELHASSLVPPPFLVVACPLVFPPSSCPLLAGRMFAVAMFAAPVSSLGCPLSVSLSLLPRCSAGACLWICASCTLPVRLVCLLCLPLVIVLWRLAPCRRCRHLAPIVLSMR